MSNLSIEYRDVSGLTEYDKNSRVHSAEQVQDVADSINEFGFTNPLLIDADGVLIAGHGRLSAARLLGMASVPCIELGHLSNEQRMAYVIADNKLAEKSDWNEDVLACELAALSGAGYNLNILGFDESELAAIIVAEVDYPDLADGDKEPFQQMTFTLHDDQVEAVLEAISAAKQVGDFDSDNENSNGNSLARICEAYNGLS